MAAKSKAGEPHRWSFFRAGGFDQVRLDSGEDLRDLPNLDQKLWVALACPAKGLEFDARTLELIDTDRDGRIRAPEILEAVKWACGMVKDAGELVKGTGRLPLAAIDDGHPEGKRLLASAKQILVNLGKGDSREISVDDTTDTAKIFGQTKFNGDGVIPADAAADASVQKVIEDVIVCLGPVTDRSGKPGVDQAKVDQFFAEAQACSDWQKKAEADAKTILPLGDATAAAHAAVVALRAKVADYFARCRLAAYDARALAAVNREEDAFLAIAAKDLTISSAEIASLPIAHVDAGRPLPLASGMNPAWADALAALRSAAVVPLLGDRDVLTEEEWGTVSTRIAPYEAWLAGRPGTAVEKLGLARIREILGGNAKAAIADLIGKDKALEPEATSIAAVDRLVRYHRDLHRLLNNFVTFRDFYSRKDKAVFQAGTLYLDQRSCDLVLRVDDAGRHATLAGLAKTCLVYCDCVRQSTGEKMTIAAAFTGGDSDNLLVGRNGVFYDRKGRDYDATITKIIDNPISIRQAFWSPYKRFVRMIEEQVAKRAAAAEAASTSKLETAATAVATADQKKPAEPKKLDIGVVAALGVAVGAIGTAIASLATGIARLAVWQIPLVVVGIFLVISGPSVLIAWLKLRQRNLGPILDANGWAVNAKAKVNIPFGASLTGVASLPVGARRDLRDPYRKPLTGKQIAFRLILTIIVVLALAGWAWKAQWPHKVFPNLPKWGFWSMPAGANGKCPVDGRNVDPMVTGAHDGKRVYLCSDECREAFGKEPAKYFLLAYPEPAKAPAEPVKEPEPATEPGGGEAPK